MIYISIAVILSIVLIIVLTSVFRLNAFISLFVTALLLAVVTLPDKNVFDILKQGFGTTISSIGFLIIFGTVIAVVLEKTNAAQSIARHIIGKLGEKRAVSAIGVTGFLAGLPIFCDSGFIILSGLAKSFSKRAKVALPFVAIVLATSLYAVHCLTPTHPGALAAAGILNANIGNLILLGMAFALPAAVVAFYWVKWRTKNEQILLDDEIAVKIDEPENLPSVRLSLLPIVAPLALIASGALLALFDLPDNFLVKTLQFVTQPVAALFIGAALSLLLLKNFSIQTLNGVMESAIEKAGPILIITAAGGMFGMVIKETGVGLYAGEFLIKTGLGLAVPFLIASILKTAQGSSTVAVITAASLVVSMLPALGLDSENGKMLAVLAMGAGSMMVSHANDSYFWVVTRFSGIDMNVTLKVYSTASVIMGLTVFLLVWLSSYFMI